MRKNFELEAEVQCIRDLIYCIDFSNLKQEIEDETDIEILRERALIMTELINQLRYEHNIDVPQSCDCQLPFKD